MPFIRSPSEQCAKPGTVEQSVHCQNVQPSPPQSAAGTSGAALFVQCAIQRWFPAAAKSDESPSALFQKSGDA